MRYQAKYVCISHPGKVRKYNQDNFIIEGNYMQADNMGSDGVRSGEILPEKQPALLGVFDGMGGEERGEMAAFLAAQSASNYALTGADTDDLQEVCRNANRAICAFAEENGIMSTGTTADLLLLGRENVSIANLGDSRIYIHNRDGLRQLSQDHVMPAPSGRKAPLLQYLGIPENEMRLEPYITTMNVESGDIYLLCSDGLTDMVPAPDIETILAEAGGNDERALEDAARTLLDHALEAGGRDNVTLLLCRLEVIQSGLKRFWTRLFG